MSSSSFAARSGVVPGTVVGGRFRIERFLGEGGMGCVFEAEHVVTGKRVALKLVTDLDEDMTHRLVREARAACAVEHPAVVPVHDIFMTEDGAVFIVMDLLSGSGLDALLRERGTLSATETARILLPIASALGAAHALGIVHRDVKPANVFVTKASEAYLLDFGVAKDQRNLDAFRTRSRAVLGTPAFMAPEQAFGQPCDHRIDVWALGLTIYACVAGHVPTMTEAPGVMFMRIARGDFPSLADAAPHAPEALTRMVGRMLSPKADDRPESMRPVFDMLASFLDAAFVALYPRPEAEPDVEATFVSDGPAAPIAPALVSPHVGDTLVSPRHPPAGLQHLAGSTDSLGALATTPRGSMVASPMTPGAASHDAPLPRTSRTTTVGATVLVLGSALALGGWLLLRDRGVAPASDAPDVVVPDSTAVDVGQPSPLGSASSDVPSAPAPVAVESLEDAPSATLGPSASTTSRSPAARRPPAVVKSAPATTAPPATAAPSSSPSHGGMF